MNVIPGLAQFDTWQLIALAAALGWASGIRLYAVLFIVGGLGYLHWVELPGGLGVLMHPWVLAASGFMFSVEFFADKVPGVDTLWDAVHTFIRIPAGAALAASVFGDSSAAATFAAAILGGSLAAGSHLAKTGSRAVINTSPEPFSNWVASFAEEAAVLGGLWAMFLHPVAFLVMLGTAPRTSPLGGRVSTQVALCAVLLAAAWTEMEAMFPQSRPLEVASRVYAPGGRVGRLHTPDAPVVVAALKVVPLNAVPVSDTLAPALFKLGPTWPLSMLSLRVTVPPAEPAVTGRVSGVKFTVAPPTTVAVVV